MERSAANRPDDGTPISGGPEMDFSPFCSSIKSYGGGTETACTAPLMAA